MSQSLASNAKTGIQTTMEPLYLKDSYQKEFESEVVSVKDGKFIVLKDTLFYPQGGGQPNDEGTISANGETYNIVFVGKFDGQISHEVDKEGIKVGDTIQGKIDWERRYQLMRMHTAAHIIAGVIHKETGAMITGGQLGVEKSRIDFSLENFDKEQMKEYIRKANQVVDAAHEIKAYTMTQEELEQSDAASKLAKGLPEGIKNMRILDIKDFDAQPDGGTHVKNTKEVGHLELLKCDNKGKNNRRAYYCLE